MRSLMAGAALLLLGGCAFAPPADHLYAQVTGAHFAEHYAPLEYETGRVEAFWRWACARTGGEWTGSECFGRIL
jgi:hypothetical protein